MASSWNGATRTPSSPFVGQHVAPVGPAERLGIGQPGPGPFDQITRSTPRRAAASSAATAAGSAARAAAPTDAYWSRSSPSALTLQGISSASSSTQDVSSSSNSPVSAHAARSRSTSRAVRSAPKNDRPVRVHTAPSASAGAPNRARAASRSRQTRATARDPMCFSSQITCATPSDRYAAKACSGCSSSVPELEVATGPWSAAGRPASGDRWRTGSSPPAPRPRSPPAHRSASGTRSRCTRVPSTSSRSSTSGSPTRDRGRGLVGRERLGRFVVDLGGRHADHLPLRVAQRGQPAAEHASGVQAHGVVDPLRLRRRRVPVEHHRPTAVVPAQGSRTGSPYSSVSPVVSPYRQNDRTRPDARPW